MNPLSARLRFRLRTLVNFFCVTASFTFFAVIVSGFPFAWIADAVAIALLFYVFFFLLENRTISLHCPHCRKYIATNTPWVCGFCKGENKRVDEYPFVHRCEKCGAEPKAYKCH